MNDVNESKVAPPLIPTAGYYGGNCSCSKHECQHNTNTNAITNYNTIDLIKEHGCEFSTNQQEGDNIQLDFSVKYCTNHATRISSKHRKTDLTQPSKCRLSAKKSTRSRSRSKCGNRLNCSKVFDETKNSYKINQYRRLQQQNAFDRAAVVAKRKEQETQGEHHNSFHIDIMNHNGGQTFNSYHEDYVDNGGEADVVTEHNNKYDDDIDEHCNEDEGSGVVVDTPKRNSKKFFIYS